MKRLLTAALLTASLGSPAHAQVSEVRTVLSGLEFPTAIAFAEDGTMYVNERPGRVRVVEDGELHPEPLAEIPTTTAAEMGLLGSALAPDESTLYVFATAADGTQNEVWAVDLASGDAEVVFGGMPASVYHNGGGLVFDRDGMLLISNGESHDTALAQDPEALGGKIYRITPTGEPTEGNEFDGPTYALGLRNPFGLTLDPVSGDAFVTENGPSSFDEIDRIASGWNLGWPDISGPANGASPSGPGEYHDPVAAYEDIIVPTGIAFADPATAQRFGGDLFFGAYEERAIHRLRLDDSRTQAVEDQIVHRSEEPIIALEWGPQGLYFSTPSAIKLLPIGGATQAAGDRTPTPRRSATPEPSASPSLPPRELSPAGTVVFLIVSAILAFGLIYTFRRGSALRRK